MMGTNEMPDDLQKFWQEENDPIQKEDVPKIMQLVQEKRQSYFELVDREVYRHYKRAILTGISSAYIASRVTLLPARIGWILIAMFCFGFALQAWRARRRKVEATQEQDVRGYCNELIGLYDVRIRDVERARWIVFPVAILMVGLVVWPYLGTWGSIFLAIAMVLLWFLLGRHDTETADDLHRRQQEVVGLLKEIDRS
jgi:Flp pilus assembly protein TadB